MVAVTCPPPALHVNTFIVLSLVTLSARIFRYNEGGETVNKSLKIVCYFANICISNFYFKKKKLKIHTAVQPVSLAEVYSF